MHVDRLGRNVGKLLWRLFRGSWTDDDDNDDGDNDVNDDDGDAVDDDVATIHPSFRVLIWVHSRQITSTTNADINLGVLLAGCRWVFDGRDK